MIEALGNTYLFEDMIKVNTSRYTCRMWRTHDGSYGEIATDNLKKDVAMRMETISSNGNAVKTIAEEVIKRAGINSVEIINRQSGDGICVHKNWP